MESFITKDWLSEKEKSSFAEHLVLLLNRNVQELALLIRDFARHVVDQLKPKTNLFGNKWFWIIIIVFVIIMAALFGPQIIKAVTSGASAATTNTNIIRAGGGA